MRKRASSPSRCCRNHCKPTYFNAEPAYTQPNPLGHFGWATSVLGIKLKPPPAARPAQHHSLAFNARTLTPMESETGQLDQGDIFSVDLGLERRSIHP